MTEDQKTGALAEIEARAAAAEARGLRFTARSWRDYAANMARRPAAGIVLAKIGWDGGRRAATGTP